MFDSTASGICSVIVIVLVIAVLWGAFHCHSFGFFTACF
jgi:hypothetical protein